MTCRRIGAWTVCTPPPSLYARALPAPRRPPRCLMGSDAWVIVRNKKGRLEVQLSAFAHSDGDEPVEYVPSAESGRRRILELRDAEEKAELRKRGQGEMFPGE